MRAGGPRPFSGPNALYGVYYGIVTQNDDPDGQAKVKLRFPWLDNGDKDQSGWAQCSMPMCGDKFGFYTLPDINDVVAVMFIAGDIRRPVVLGGIHSKTDATPEANGNGKNDFRGYKSRAGARMIMDDSSNGKVLFADKTDKNVVGIGKFTEGGDGPNKMAVPVPKGINGSPQQGIGIASMEGKLNITCPKGKLKISAMHVEITSKTKIEIKAGGELTLEGTAMGKVCSAQAGKYEGSSTKIGP